MATNLRIFSLIQSLGAMVYLRNRSQNRSFPTVFTLYNQQAHKEAPLERGAVVDIIMNSENISF